MFNPMSKFKRLERMVDGWHGTHESERYLIDELKVENELNSLRDDIDSILALCGAEVDYSEFDVNEHMFYAVKDFVVTLRTLANTFEQMTSR